MNVYSSYRDNVWEADLADMQLLRKYNRTSFLLFAIDVYCKYARNVLSKDKKDITINCTFKKFLDKSDCKSNKIWVGQASEFYNKSMKLWQ